MIPILKCEYSIDTVYSTVYHIDVSLVIVYDQCHLNVVCAMDPHDRLWGELIFPWCGGGPALLPLRMVCCSFLAQLNESRLWLPWTLELPQLRRPMGWRGVEQAMRREANTRANCAAGHFLLGPVLHVPCAETIMIVASRAAVFCRGSVGLFDLDTGVLVSSFDTGSMSFELHDNVVLDRWILFSLYRRR